MKNSVSGIETERISAPHLLHLGIFLCKRQRMFGGVVYLTTGLKQIDPHKE
jgi:hypothetical protein